MKHYLIALALSLCCFGAAQGQKLPAGMNPAQARQMAQSASGQQLAGYVKQAKAAGYSLNDVKSLLRAQGASMADIAQAEAVWNENSSTASTQISIDNPMLVSNFGNLSYSAASNNQRDSSSRFGSAFFRSGQNGSEVPQLYIATPSDYQLGPGDELLISLYGASEESYTVQLTREGTIKVDRLAPIYLSGLSIEDAKARLLSRFSEIYTGLKAADNDPSKVSLALSLQNARSVVVNITGQVNTPGTYTLSAFTSVINALYAAGGPNNAGSYRAVRLLRGGRIIKEIDL